MGSRPLSLAIVLSLIGLAAATRWGVSLWTCPLAAMGGSCPACGLTRAAADLLRGGAVQDVHGVAAMLLLVPVVLLLAGATLPGKLSESLRRCVWRVERVLLPVPLYVVLLTLYWLWPSG